MLNYGVPDLTGNTGSSIKSVTLEKGFLKALQIFEPRLSRHGLVVKVVEDTETPNVIVLTISGERKTEHEDSSQGYHRVERAYGRFSRSLSLPRGVDADQVQAEFDKGVLEVRIPKPSESKAHRVEIGSSVNGEAREK